MLLEKAPGLALIQFCKVTNGCTQSDPYKKRIEELQVNYSGKFRFDTKKLKHLLPPETKPLIVNFMEL